MAIPLAILESWSNKGAVQTPKQLREKIERILTGPNSKIQQKNKLNIYLQGSYRNNTNIYGNSDVDIVLESNAVFYSDISNLNTYEKSIYNKSFSTGTYGWSEFKDEVIETLQNYYGNNKVKVGNKSIEIDDGSYEADVIPCFEYRKYITFGEESGDQKYIPGIKFFTTNEMRSVVNYPKEHYSRGVFKNQQVNKKYKPTIRIFKNFRNKLIEKNMINKSQVPSYFLENLLYNVPNSSYAGSNDYVIVFDILRWLHINKNSMSRFICQNEQTYLFGSSQEQWQEEDARTFIDQAIILWNGW